MYLSYHQLVSGPWLDKILWTYLGKRLILLSLYSWWYTGSYTMSIVVFALWTRSLITNTMYWIALHSIMTAYAIEEGLILWPLFFICVELIRYGIYHLPSYISNNLDGVFMKIFSLPNIQSLFRLLYQITRTKHTTNELIATCKKYLENPTEGKFNEEELEQFKATIKRLNYSSFIWTEHTSAMILDKVFLFIHKGKPSVLIADLKIIYSQSTELNCPVCRESKSGYVELNCGTDENKHKNCLECFVDWFSTQSTCPECRHTTG